MEAENTTEGENKPRKCLGRCLLFFWLGVTFDVVGASVLLLGVFTAEPYWDMLLYLGSSCCFLSLLWWVCWYSGNIELDPEDASGKPLPPGLSFIGLVHTISQSVALHKESTTRGFSTTFIDNFSCLLRGPQPLLSTPRSALLSQAIKGKLKKACSSREWHQGYRQSYGAQGLDYRSKSQRTDGAPGPEAVAGQHRGAEPWFTQRPYTHPGKVVIQPQSSTFLVSQKQLWVQRLGRAFRSRSLDASPARPRLARGYTWPGQPLCVMRSISMPTLLESASAAFCTSCPPRAILHSPPPSQATSGGCPETPPTALPPPAPVPQPSSHLEPIPSPAHHGHFCAVPL